jgi:cold shock CspA family protein
LVVVV